MFYRRHRALEAGDSPYVAVMDSLSVKESVMQIEVLNTKNNVRLLLQLYGLDSNSARLKINELKPIRSRYEIPMGDVLIGEPKEQP